MASMARFATKLGGVMDCIEGFRRSQVLFTAVRAGFFEAARQPPGKTAAALAAELSLSADGTERLADACVALGFLRKDAQGYVNTDEANQYLTNDSPDSAVGYIRHSQDLLMPLWSDLGGAVAEGTNRWHSVFQASSADMFATVYQRPEALAAFQSSMHSFGAASSAAIAARLAPELAHFRHVVDLGGGTGHLAMALLEHAPALTGSVLELPAAVPNAQRRVDACPTALRQRLQVLPCDMFGDLAAMPPQTDLVVLGRILHDWDDPTCAKLLAAIAARTPPGGGILLAEMVLADDKAQSDVSALLQSLNMLVQTQGKERSGAEYTAMLEAAGYTNVRILKTGAYLDAVLATRQQK